MVGRCSRRGPLTRAGASQPDRAPEALDPGYAPIDGRSLSDLLVFAQRYSRHIKFYNQNGAEEGDWQPFFASDPAAIFAALGHLPLDTMLEVSRSLRDWLVADPARHETQLKNHFQLLFHLPIMLLQDLGDYFDRLGTDDELRAAILVLVERDLDSPLRDLIAYEKGSRPPANDVELVPDAGLSPDLLLSPLELPVVVTERIDGSARISEMPVSAELFSPIAPAGWTAFYEAIEPSGNPYGMTGSVYDDIADAMNYGALTKAFERVFQAVERIIGESSAALERALASDDHAPQFALWLAFLQLFSVAQDSLNEFTERHLDFYYRDVLGLSPRAAESNSAHVLFELKKGVDEHLLVAGTRFKAGKDGAGTPVVYALDADSVINRASVAELRALYRPTEHVGSEDLLRAFASTVANSADGAGAELPEDQPGWPPFGPGEQAPAARLGFAIADGRLFLREGTRTIEVEVGLSAADSAALAGRDLTDGFRALLSGEEGWIAITRDTGLSVNRVGNSLEFVVQLSADEGAVVAVSEEIHGSEPGAGLPVVRFELALDLDTSSSVPAAEALTALASLQFTSIQLRVSASGLRLFTAQNDSGTIDPSKPFEPFGTLPEVGSRFTIGSSEAFSKPLASFALDLQWAEEIDEVSYFHKTTLDKFTAEITHLAAGTWGAWQPSQSTALFDYRNVSIVEVPTDLGYGGEFMMPARMTMTRRLMSRGRARVAMAPISMGDVPSSTQEQLFLAIEGYLSRDQTFTKRVGYLAKRIELASPYELSTAVVQSMADVPYSTSAKAGFIRLTLQQDFGHDKHTDVKTLALIAASTGDTTLVDDLKLDYNFDGSLPRDPYTPTITALTLSYTTARSEPGAFFHLHPFGYAEAKAENARLLPPLDWAGELFIGIADLDPPQSVRLLFQVVDGTANPLKSRTDLSWSYLSDEGWTPLEDEDVEDGTDDLTTSGIAVLSVPDDASTDNPLMPVGMHWIRVAVESDTDAVNDLLTVDARAAIATFIDEGNDPAFLDTPLPAGTITKLETSDASVKSVTQPYESFGGRAAETEDAFRLRVSERLRHKDRAATIWDYERLVLEAFPSVYRVKCISHTQLWRDEANGVLADNELRPGYVVVTPIPYVMPGGTVDPLRPYTDVGTLEEIRQHLVARTSPFVQLEVQNPKIEEVKVRFNVAFTEDVADPEFYRNELKAAIIRFLTPWSYDEGADITFGGKWHKASIINFVEEQEYVDYVSDFEMIHRPDIESVAAVEIDVETIEPTAARSILVSAADHEITLLT